MLDIVYFRELLYKLPLNFEPASDTAVKSRIRHASESILLRYTYHFFSAV